jgi:hypothetical protein
MTDVPTLTNATTANYCVMNPLNGGSNRISPTDANLTLQVSAGGNAFFGSPATFSMTSGKWYWEYTQGTVNSETCGIATKAITGSLLDAETFASLKKVKSIMKLIQKDGFYF